MGLEQNMESDFDYILENKKSLSKNMVDLKNTLIENVLDLTNEVAPKHFTSKDWENLRKIITDFSKENYPSRVPSEYKSIYDPLPKNSDINIIDSYKSLANWGFNDIVRIHQIQESPDMRGFFQAFSQMVITYFYGGAITNDLSEAILIASFVSPLFNNIFLGFSNLKLQWGEMSLKASSWRRNKTKDEIERKIKDVEEGEVVVEIKEVMEDLKYIEEEEVRGEVEVKGEVLEKREGEDGIIEEVVLIKGKKIRRRIGQKTDLILTEEEYKYEVGLMEVKKPETLDSLVQEDRSKIIKGMFFINKNMQAYLKFDEASNVFESWPI